MGEMEKKLNKWSLRTWFNALLLKLFPAKEPAHDAGALISLAWNSDPYLFGDAPWLDFVHDVAQRSSEPASFSIQDYFKRKNVEFYVRIPTVRDSDHTAMLYSRNDVASLQALLTFGLLEGLFGRPISQKELVSKLPLGRSGEGKVLQLVNVPAMLKDWYNEELKSQRLPQERATEAIQVLLYAHQVFCTHAMNEFGVFRLYRPKMPQKIDQIVGQIGALIEACIFVSARLFKFNHPGVQLFNSSFFEHYDSLKQQMTEDGWCRRTVALLMRAGSFSLMGYASTLEPFIRNPSVGHWRCSQFECFDNHVMGASAHYEPKHRGSGSCCQTMITPDLDKVKSLLKEGRIPVVQFREGKLETMDSEGRDYVAISHVWADGLGSSSGALPICQIVYLSEMLSDFSSGTTFWIDSFCIPPRGGDEDKELRRKAIELISTTFIGAKKVLVLDSGIRLVPKSARREEKLLRIHCSGWAQRLWTLHEGTLGAKELCFMFQGGAEHFDINELNMHNNNRWLPEWNLSPVLGVLSYRLNWLRSSTDLKSRGGVALLISQLRWRSTSHTDDETLVVGEFLRGDGGKGHIEHHLQAADVETRMQELLTRVRNVPRSIAFSTGPKITTNGFKWAPITLLGRDCPADPAREEMGLPVTGDLSRLSDSPAITVIKPWTFSNEDPWLAAVTHTTTIDPTQFETPQKPEAAVLKLGGECTDSGLRAKYHAILFHPMSVSGGNKSLWYVELCDDQSTETEKPIFRVRNWGSAGPIRFMCNMLLLMKDPRTVKLEDTCEAIAVELKEEHKGLVRVPDTPSPPPAAIVEEDSEYSLGCTYQRIMRLERVKEGDLHTDRYRADKRQGRHYGEIRINMG